MPLPSTVLSSDDNDDDHTSIHESFQQRTQDHGNKAFDNAASLFVSLVCTLTFRHNEFVVNYFTGEAFEGRVWEACL